LARPFPEALEIHRSAARLGEAQDRMSEPHILKLPRSRGLPATTKGGSLPGTQAFARAPQPFPVPIAAEVLIEDAATMHEVSLSDSDSAVFLR
jgi:hypothetical protein